MDADDRHPPGEPDGEGTEDTREHLLDPLTRLPNRPLLFDRIEQRLREATRSASPFALFLIEVQELDVALDGLPEDAADKALACTAERLRGTLRESDTLARLYHHTFAALLPTTHDPMGIHVLAERVREVAAVPMPVYGRSVTLETRIGAVRWPEDGDDRPALLRNADAALARARDEEVHYKVYQPMLALAQERQSVMVRDLSRAIERHEFEVHYQPQVALASGRVEGVEALVRWRHRDLGMLPPMDFIPLAESSATIFPLTMQVLDQVLAQAAAWREAGLQLPVSVNLSPRVLHQRTLVDRIVECQSRHGVPAHMLTLEIAESGVHGPSVPVARTLRALSMADFRIAIDDFGTGFSSLKCLRDLPVDEIKIDPLFTQALGSAGRDESIVRAMVELAEGFDARVIAEGVESERMVQALRELGATHGQGFHLCPALPAEECASWCRRRLRAGNPGGEATGPGPRLARIAGGA